MGFKLHNILSSVKNSYMTSMSTKREKGSSINRMYYPINMDILLSSEELASLIEKGRTEILKGNKKIEVTIENLDITVDQLAAGGKGRTTEGHVLWA